MKTSFTNIIVSILTVTAFAASAVACDFCGCYQPQIEAAASPFTTRFSLSVAEQFTHYGTDVLDGRRVDNPVGEYLDSSITQVVLGCALSDRIGVQVNVPFIYRAYKRPNDAEVETGRASGLGDVTLVARAIVFQRGGDASWVDGGETVGRETGASNFAAVLSVDAGLKMPTGDARRLSENYNGADTGGIGAHDLALGSGSWDGIFGAHFQGRLNAFFVEADVHYALRGQGSHEFRYANDLQWSGGPGVYLLRTPRRSLAVQCNVSGETKGYDYFQGEPDSDSSITALYIGPRVIASSGAFSGEIGAELPVLMNATGLQTTPDFRIRCALTWRF